MGRQGDEKQSRGRDQHCPPLRSGPSTLSQGPQATGHLTALNHVSLQGNQAYAVDRKPLTKVKTAENTKTAKRKNV